MFRIITFIGILFLLYSCIPLRIAPSIDDYKITKGKKFKRGLPKREMFIFEDPKDANQFYNYVNIKFELGDEDVYDDVPFKINGQQYFFSFYEVEIPTKTINLIPLVIDGLLDSADMGPFLEDAHASRVGNWYIAIEAYTDFEQDCLQENSLSREVVLKYLRTIKQEYLSTYNYNEVVFKN
ncbi:hypothetical protein [Ulvibacterium marinum]|uniref:Lipoprotein n=1 Tax=Ulvibacterium marinum TaxID=2419782 RepID=A0A3B0CDW7_9FLAO|nr:hypothetical protein [Ulvibacterium marinum]RKN82794.1 hypothetical protein D7Z94_02835 [Ulvibacterium marinum]